jgi:hypothetical protein
LMEFEKVEIFKKCSNSKMFGFKKHNKNHLKKTETKRKKR